MAMVRLLRRKWAEKVPQAGRVRGLQSAIGKSVGFSCKPWKRLPGVAQKRNMLRSSSMAPESPPLSRSKQGSNWPIQCVRYSVVSAALPSAADATVGRPKGES